MKKIILAAWSAIVLCSGCRPPLQGLDLLFPESGFVAGWKWDGNPEHYAPENLYELINGEAELYHEYGFQELAVLTYYAVSPEDSFFTVSVYDMGTPENAFGVYSSYRYPGYDFHPIGAEAMVSDFGVKFYKSRYFVNIDFGDADASIQTAGLDAARRIAGNIEGPAEPPGIIHLLPSSNQVGHSLRYAADEMLNQSFLPGGVEAQYDLDGQKGLGFVIQFEDSARAASGLERLEAFYTESGLKTESEAIAGHPGFTVETKYQGTLTAVQKNRRIVGAREFPRSSQSKKMVAAILAGLE